MWRGRIALSSSQVCIIICMHSYTKCTTPKPKNPLNGKRKTRNENGIERERERMLDMYGCRDFTLFAP